MRRAHWLRVNANSELPSNCIFVDTETLPVELGGGEVEMRLHFGWACYTQRHDGLNFTESDWKRFETRAQFWRWAKGKARKRTKLYIFAHNMSFDFTVLGGFENLHQMGWKLIRSVIESPPTILTFRKRKKTITLLCTLNYFRVSLAKLAKDLGMEKLSMPETWDDKNEGDCYCIRDVEIIREAMLSLFRRVKDWDLGNFQHTLPAQAFAAFRHRFLSVPIWIDDKESALEISRAGYYGGRTECFFIGKTREKLYLLDINSQYPYTMKTTPVPTRLLSVIKNPSLSEIKGILMRRCVIAECYMNAKTPAYPTIYNNKLIFPVGEFRTNLATPELKYALKHKDVESVHRLVVFERDIVFSEYVDYFYGKRLEAKRAGNGVDDFFCKLMANSLYGKFGQSGGVYEITGEVEHSLIRRGIEFDTETGETTSYREYAGIRQERIGDSESQDSFPAIAAHITSEARCYLWRLMCLAKRENVFYTDTDSLLVNAAGLTPLRKFIDNEALGGLKIVLETESTEVRGLKDYVMGDIEKIKGIKNVKARTASGGYTQDSFLSFKGLIARGDINIMVIRRVIKHLTREYKKGTIEPSGRVVPLRFKLKT